MSLIASQFVTGNFANLVETKTVTSGTEVFFTDVPPNIMVTGDFTQGGDDVWMGLTVSPTTGASPTFTTGQLYSMAGIGAFSNSSTIQSANTMIGTHVNLAGPMDALGKNSFVATGFGLQESGSAKPMFHVEYACRLNNNVLSFYRLSGVPQLTGDANAIRLALSANGRNLNGTFKLYEITP